MSDEMKFASFDLEIMTEIPEECEDWKSLGPLGISCAAVACTGMDNVKFWYGCDGVYGQNAKRLVWDLEKLVADGYRIVTWNGASFDFNVLAQESGLFEECGKLAMEHTDMMLLVTFQKGHYLALQTACKGAGLKGKLKTVTLKDGTALTDMDGAKAPAMWAKGEYDAVLAYLEDDVRQPLELAHYIEMAGGIKWTSQKGRPQRIGTKMLTVKECFDLPEPDTSWMTDPPTRDQFISWIPTTN